MRNRYLRIAVVAMLICACAVLFGGCFFMTGGYVDSYSDCIDMRESVSEGYFKLTIHTAKDTFAMGEEIDCWAELEYIGDQESITVYNTYGSPITMQINGANVYYNSSPWSFDVLKQDTLTLVKGQPLRYKLSEYMKTSSVLPGTYEIDAYASLSLTPDDAVCYDGYVSAVIVVEDNDEDKD